MIVVPHELTHLVFATATDNPFHEPPHWLNEGLAVYLSEGYTASYRSARRPGRRGRDDHRRSTGLAGAFPTTYDRFRPRLRRERLGRRLHHQDLRQGRARQADPLVRHGRDRRRGVQGGARRRRGRRSRPAGSPALGAKAPVPSRAAAGAAGTVPDGWSGAAPIPSVGPGTRIVRDARRESSASGRDPARERSASGPILIAVVLAAVIRRRPGVAGGQPPRPTSGASRLP